MIIGWLSGSTPEKKDVEIAVKPQQTNKQKYHKWFIQNTLKEIILCIIKWSHTAIINTLLVTDPDWSQDLDYLKQNKSTNQLKLVKLVNDKIPEPTQQIKWNRISDNNKGTTDVCR